MVADKRKPVKDIAVSGFSQVDLIGNGLARVWMFLNHVDEDGKIERRRRKRPLQMPIEAFPHLVELLSKAMARSMTTADRQVVATVTDGDDRDIEERR